MSFAATLSPNDRWEIDYGDTRCRLIRHFGTTDQRYRLEVERGWSFGGFDWKLYGKGIKAYSLPTSITVTLDRPVSIHRFKTNPYMFYENGERAIGWNDIENVLLAELQDNQHIRLTGEKNLDVALDLPNVRQAIRALEECEDDLLAGWGLDAKQFRALTIKATPSNYPGRWATNKDYPRADLASKNEGTATFLLKVGADGSIAACRIVGSTGFSSLDARTCELLLARAAFHPVRDSTGQAVESFYVNKIRWQVPR